MYRHVKEMKDETSQSRLMHGARTIHMDGECVHLKLTLYTYARRNFVSVWTFHQNNIISLVLVFCFCLSSFMAVAANVEKPIEEKIIIAQLKHKKIQVRNLSLHRSLVKMCGAIWYFFKCSRTLFSRIKPHDHDSPNLAIAIHSWLDWNLVQSSEAQMS